ncbi:MAG: phosphoribosyltransferase domain-containing protein [Desulfamplus sp.]|nr:phosphoribosyltransferase domain-containing protein [Desulfamplus sp.]
MLKDFYHLKRENNPHREDAFTLSCLGKLYPASDKDLSRCRAYLSDLIDDSFNIGDKDEILIIGLTESGIIPALLMQIEAVERNINSNILYSTRRRSVAGIPFKESHSHGPDHILHLPLLPFREIWIVEDEITSGNTAYNLMVKLCEYLNIRRVRIFAFADFRDEKQKSDFAIKTKKNNINCTIHTLNHNIYKNQKSEKEILKTTKTISKPLNNRLKSRAIDLDNSYNSYKIDIKPLDGWYFPKKRPALSIKSDNFLDAELLRFDPDILSDEWKCCDPDVKKTILAVGEAVDLAAYFALSNKNVQFQQISLSPWRVDNSSIFSKISFLDRYYLYNYENLIKEPLNPIFILCDPIDKNIEHEAVTKLKGCGIDLKPLFK